METIELTEDNYCDQQSVSLELSFEEHDLLNDILTHALEMYDFVGYFGIDKLPNDSEMKLRYNMLKEMRNCSLGLWQERFGNAPYNNN